MTTEQSADDTVLDDVFAHERDRGGNSAPPEAEAKPEPKADPNGQPEAQPAEPNPSQEQVTDPETGRMVPLAELTSERKKFQGKLSEAERRAIAAEERAKLLEDQMARSTRQQPQHQPQAQQVQVPDPYQEPEKYAEYMNQTVEERLFIQGLDFSERLARQAHGSEAVDAAFKAAEAAGLIGRSHFIQTDPKDPWGALMEWHKQQQVLATVGDDPDAYRKKIEEEIRAKVLEELKAGTGPGTQGAQPQRFPGTLAESTPTGQQGAHLTSEAAMNAVFSTDRDRRK